MPVEQLIFTDRPRGTGIDAAAAGLQIAACSAGLSPEARWQLASICMHLGQAFSISHAPRAAIEREQAWLAQTDSRQVVPDQVLDAFPVIWSYDRLADGQFALTRARYTCLTNDGRTGNFFAHALVFDPNDLTSYGHNPLALSRSPLFRSHDPSDDVTLPALADLGNSIGDHPGYELLRAAPCRDHLASLVSALCMATPAARPVVICLADWRQATPLVEALLDLLPPSTRCRTTISTYESDRTWVVPTKAGRPTGLAAAHHLLVLCGADDRSFNLRPDEYRSVYAVFNFVGSHFGEPTTPHRCSAFAAQCVLDGQMDRLATHHVLVERLGFGADVNAWDALVSAADLPAAQPTQEAVAEATRSLAALATQPPQAQIALELLLPHVRSLALAEYSPGLIPLATDLAVLTDRAATGTPDVARAHPCVVEFQHVARDAFGCGQGRIAAAFLKACGRARDAVLLALLMGALNESPAALPASLNAADREQTVNLLLDGLRLAEKAPAVSPSQAARLLVFTFRMAREVGLVADVWERLGEVLVKPRLSGEWNVEKQVLAHDLMAWTPADLCPEANAWLNLRLLETMKPRGKDLIARLAETAYAGSRCTGAADLTAQLLHIAEEQFPEKEQFAVAAGRMAEATRGTASGQALFVAYQDALKQVKAERHNHVHQRLAEAGVVHVLCRELLAEVLPWNVEDSPKKYQRWRDVVLRFHTGVLDGLRQEVVALLGEPGQTESVLPLAHELVFRQPKEPATGPGLAALYGSLTLALPLEPLSDRWGQVFAALPEEGMASETGARLRVLKFMRQIQQRSGEPDWSTTRFPEADPVWQHDVRLLSPGERAKLLGWCVGTFATHGVTTPEEAQGLAKLLDSAGEQSPHVVVGAVDQLLKGRDPVTRVLVATAFARCALEAPESPEKWTGIVKTILEQFDADTQRLFDAHLTLRFCRRDQAHEARLDQLRVAVGLAQPKPASPPSRAQAIADSSSSGPRAAGVLDGLKHRLHKLVSGPEAPAEPPDHRKKEK